MRWKLEARQRGFISAPAGAEDSLRGEPRPAEAHAVGPLPALFALPVPDSVLLVHHLLQQGLVVSVERGHADVSHGPELTAVVQVLVFQSEEVPDKPPRSKRQINIFNSLIWVFSIRFPCHFKFQPSLKQCFRLLICS